MTSRERTLGQYIGLLLADGTLTCAEALAHPSKALARLTVAMLDDAAFVLGTVATEAGRRALEQLWSNVTVGLTGGKRGTR